jgi:hypothetical protein
MRVWLGWVNERSHVLVSLPLTLALALDPNLAAASRELIRSTIKIMSRRKKKKNCLPEDAVVKWPSC